MAIIRVTRVADIDSRNKLIGTDVRYIWFVILQSRSVAFFSYSTLRWFFSRNKPHRSFWFLNLATVCTVNPETGEISGTDFCFITDRVSRQSIAIGRVRPPVCFHSNFWRRWPLIFILPEYGSRPWPCVAGVDSRSHRYWVRVIVCKDGNAVGLILFSVIATLSVRNSNMYPICSKQS